ncbi:MAG: hypothetical protein Q9210_006645 [Variospora velana]
MDFNNTSVPPEILIGIIECLPCKEIRSLRAVCRDLNEYASPFAIQRVYLSTQWKDRENLTRISQHPILSKSVHEIFVDATNYDEDLFGLAAYQSFFAACKDPLGGEPLYTQIAVTRGHALYREACDEDATLKAYCGNFLTRSIDDDFRPHGFEKMLFNPTFFYRVAEYLPDDLVRLVRALPRLPNAVKITLSDHRSVEQSHYHCHGTYDEYTFTIKNENQRGCEAVILDPRPWPHWTDECDYIRNKAWYRGFRVIVQALAMSSHHNIKYFGIGRKEANNGLWWQMLQVPSQEADMLDIAFSQLRVISLNIDTRNRVSNEWFRDEPVHSLAHALSSAPDLRKLRIALDHNVEEIETQVTSLNDLIGQPHHWKHLQCLSLAGMTISRRNFIDFLLLHHQSLRALTLTDVFLAPESWVETDYDNISNLFDWKTLLLSLGRCNLNLSALTVGAQYQEWYHACNWDAVQRLCHSGGQDRPLIDCSHSLRFRNNPLLSRRYQPMIRTSPHDPIAVL